MGYSYNGADCVLNDLMADLIVGKKIFLQSVKDDPGALMFYNKLLRREGVGENNYIKINAGNTFQTTPIAENSAWQSDIGTVDIQKTSNIALKELTMRARISKKLWVALRKKVMAGTALTGGDLNDLIETPKKSFMSNIARITVGDGTGNLFYCQNASSSVTVKVTDAAGTLLPASHWVWDFLYGRVDSKVGSGMKLDFVITTTGLHPADACLDNEIVSLDPSAGTLTMATAVDLSAGVSDTDYYFGRYTCDFSDTGTSATTALYVEPMGIGGLINTTAAMQGITNQRWLSKSKNANSAELDTLMLDSMIYALKGNPKNLALYGDPEVLSLLEFQAHSMLKLAPSDQKTVMGFKGLVYRHASAGEIAYVPLNYLFGTKRVYLINVDAVETIGTEFIPTPIRGKFEWSQANAFLFDDWTSEFENVMTERNSSGYIYNLKGGW